MNYSKKMMLLASVLLLMAAWQSCASKAKAPATSTSTSTTRVEQVAVYPSNPDDDKIYGLDDIDQIDQAVQYKGGSDELNKFIAMNLKYPEKAYSKGIVGRVVVQFVVEKDGTLTNFMIKTPAHDLLNEEALRVMKKADAFIPAMSKGKAVRSQYSQPFVFMIKNH